MILSRDTVLACSRQTSFQRGEKYYKQGRVTNFRQSEGNTLYRAEVVGTDRYTVSLDVATLTGECNCYAFDGESWCKHIVALALVVAEGEVGADEPTVKKRPYEARKAKLEELIAVAKKDQLASALTLIADRFPETYEFVQKILDPPTLDSEKTILRVVKDCLRPVKSARSWERQVEAAFIAQEEMRLLAQGCLGTVESVRGLLQAAQYVYRQLDRIDDSDGTLQDACASLCERALEIVGSDPERFKLIDEALAIESDLPLADIILQSGTKEVAEHLVARLDKHLFKRDQSLARLTSESALYLLSHYYAFKGDERLLDLLSEHAMHERAEEAAMVRYHEARQEWQELIKLLWPDRKHDNRDLLRRALSEAHDIKKLITLQVEETLTAHDLPTSFVRLEHLLEQNGQMDKLPKIIEGLLANESLLFGNRLWLLLKQGLSDQAADVMISALRQDEKLRARERWSMQPYAVVDHTVQYLAYLEEADSEAAQRVWEELFKLESDRVLKTNQYDRFRQYGDKLVELGQEKRVREIADIIIEGYPTRKKLVEICSEWIRV